MIERYKVEALLSEVGARLCPRCDGTGRKQNHINGCIIKESDCDACRKKGVVKQ